MIRLDSPQKVSLITSFLIFDVISGGDTFNNGGSDLNHLGDHYIHHGQDNYRALRDDNQDIIDVGHFARGVPPLLKGIEEAVAIILAPQSDALSRGALRGPSNPIPVPHIAFEH